MKLNWISSKTLISLLISGVIFLMLFISCEEGKKDPSIETTSLDYLSLSSFKATAQIFEKGDYGIVDHGFVYTIGLTSTPENSYFGNTVSLGKSINSNEYTAIINIGSIQYYSNGSKCYVRSYITNEKGTIFGNIISKDLLKLQVSNVSPNKAKVGDIVTINGQNFSTILNQNAVTFNGVGAAILSATSTILSVRVPNGISTSYYDQYADIRVITEGQTYDLNNSFQLKTSLISFSPNTGSWSTYITIYGNNLYNSALYFDNVFIGNYNSYSNSFSCSIPYSFLKKQFKIYVDTGGEKAEVPGGYFTMTSLSINPLTQVKFFPGSLITFTGSGFHPSSVYNKLIIDGKTIASNSYSSMQFNLPTTLASGDYPITVTNSLDSVKLVEKVTIIRPTLSGLSPLSGYPGTRVKIRGEYLSSSINSNIYVNFGSTSVSTNSIYPDSIKTNAPWMAPGNYSVSVSFGSFVVSCPDKFTIVEPKFTSIVPSSGVAGSSVVINGEGFGTNNYINVYFGNLYASVMSYTNTQINVKVPNGITSGNWTVKVIISNYQLSSTPIFNVP